MGLYLRPCRATGFGVEQLGFIIQGSGFGVYRGTSAVKTFPRRSVFSSIKKIASKIGRPGQEMGIARGTPDLITLKDPSPVRREQQIKKLIWAHPITADPRVAPGPSSGRH